MQAGYGGTTTGTGTGTTTGTTERTSYGTTGTTGTEAHTWTTQPTAYETTTATATGERGYTERAQVAKDVVCGQEYFTKTEDRPVVKEVIETIREHHPVEKEYVVSVKWANTEG